MNTRRQLFVFALAASAVAADWRAAAAEPRKNPLVWDAVEKTIEARPGDGAAEFMFDVTNKGARAVTIQSTQTSCGCTVAELPSLPWTLAPGASSVMKVTVDFSGKDGWLAKSVTVASSEGSQTLYVTVKIPPPDEAQRARNRQLAMANRQAVFRNDCASCHAAPLGTKLGRDLFKVACEVCHASPRRASMVPDLAVAREPRDAAYWAKWIAEGREGTLMPAFAAEHGGPLTREQIASLVDFALEQLPTEPRKNG
jgi:mono/diheme cytochrome c family protein